LGELLLGLSFLELLVGADLFKEYEALRGGELSLYGHFQDFLSFLQFDIGPEDPRVVVIIIERVEEACYTGVQILFLFLVHVSLIKDRLVNLENVVFEVLSDLVGGEENFELNLGEELVHIDPAEYFLLLLPLIKDRQQ